MYDLFHSNGRYQKAGHLFTADKFCTSKNTTLFENKFKNALVTQRREGTLTTHAGQSSQASVYARYLDKTAHTVLNGPVLCFTP